MRDTRTLTHTELLQTNKQCQLVPSRSTSRIGKDATGVLRGSRFRQSLCLCIHVLCGYSSVAAPSAFALFEHTALLLLCFCTSSIAAPLLLLCPRILCGLSLCFCIRSVDPRPAFVHTVLLCSALCCSASASHLLPHPSLYAHAL